MTLCGQARSLTQPTNTVGGQADREHGLSAEATPQDGNLPVGRDWHLPVSVIQGSVTITTIAGAADEYRAQAESQALSELQSRPENSAFRFWEDPQEDVYEDLERR